MDNSLQDLNNSSHPTKAEFNENICKYLTFKLISSCTFFKTLASLRSKRFQSSYCAKVRAEAIKKKSGTNFLNEPARKRLLRRLNFGLFQDIKRCFFS